MPRLPVVTKMSKLSLSKFLFVLLFCSGSCLSFVRTAVANIATEVAELEVALANQSGEDKIITLRKLIKLTKKFDTGLAINYAELLDGIDTDSNPRRYLGNIQELATLYMVISDNEKSNKTIDRLISESERLQVPEMVVEALLVQVSVAVNSSSMEKAQALLSVSRQKMSDINNPHIMARLNYQDAIVHFYMGDNENALALAKAAIPAFEQANDLSMRAGSENLVGIFYGSMARYQESLHYLLKALDSFVLLENQQKQLSVYNNLAVTYDRLEQPQKALEIYQKTIQLCQAIGDVQSESLALLNMASVHYDLGQREDAIAALVRGDNLAKEIDDTSLRARAYNLRSELAFDDENFIESEALAKNAIDLANTMQSPLTQFASYHRLTNALVAQLKLEEALESAKTMLALAHGNKSRGEESTALLKLADVYKELGQSTLALDVYRKGMELRLELLNEQSAESLTRMQARFESQEKDAEISRMTLQNALEQKQHNAEIALQKHQTYLIGGGLTAVFAIALLIYMRVSQQHMNTRLKAEIKEKTYHLEKKHEALVIANQKLEEQSYNDPLTGLANRRFGMTFVPQQSDELLSSVKAEDSGDRHQLLVVDIDHFKSINDTYGHTAGDLVIQHVAKLLRQCFDESDYIIRWGGEEFLIMMRYSTFDKAAEKAETLREAVVSHSCKISDKHEVHCSCSIGIAQYPFFSDRPEHLAWTQVLEIADKCLYDAKQTGRNRWVGIDSTNLQFDEALSKTLLQSTLSEIQKQDKKLAVKRWDI